MKKTSLDLLRLVLGSVAIVTALLFGAPSAQAANQAWIGANATSGDWSTVDNWSGGAAPTSADTATFNATITNGWGNSTTPVALSADTAIKSIAFTGNASSYFIGTTGGTNKFLLTSGGSITIGTNASFTGNGTVFTINAPLQIQNAGSGGNGTYDIINNSNGSGVGSGSFTLNGAITGNATSGNTTTLTIRGRAASSGTTVFNINSNIGDGTNGGKLSLTLGVNNATSTFNLTGTNTFTGNLSTTASATIVVSSDANLGGGTQINLTQNGKLKTTGSFTTAKNITLSGTNAGINPNVGTTLIIDGSLGSSGNSTGQLNGAGTIRLNGSGNFSAGYTLAVQNGQLDLGKSDALNGATLSFTGGNLDNVAGGGSAFTTPTGIAGLNLSSAGAGFTFVGTNSLDLSGIQTGFTGTTVTRVINVTANTLTMNGIMTTGTLTSTGAALVDGALSKSGNGTLVLAGASSYTLGTTVTGGTLSLNGAGGTLADTGAVTVNGGTLDVAQSDTIGALLVNGNGSVVSGVGTLTASSYQINTAVGNSGTISAALAGSGAFSKTGLGKGILSGTNTYTGTTTVSAGTLLINGSTSASSDVTVDSGATLGGNGTIGGNVTVAGNLSPGNNSAETLTINGALLLQGTSLTTMEISANGTQFDRLVGIQALTYGGNLTLSLSGTYGPSSWDLFDFVSKTGDFANVDLTGSYVGSLTRTLDTWSGTVGGQNWTFEQTTGVLSVIPEPSAWLLTALGLTVTMVFRRRRRS